MFRIPIFILMVSGLSKGLPNKQPQRFDLSSLTVASSEPEPPEVAQVNGLGETIAEILQSLLNTAPSLHQNLIRASERKEGLEAMVDFTTSEPIVDIEDDGNFTLTPPERPLSAPY